MRNGQTVRMLDEEVVDIRSESRRRITHGPQRASESQTTRLWQKFLRFHQILFNHFKLQILSGVLVGNLIHCPLQVSLQKSLFLTFFFLKVLDEMNENSSNKSFRYSYEKFTNLFQIFLRDTHQTQFYMAILKNSIRNC